MGDKIQAAEACVQGYFFNYYRPPTLSLDDLNDSANRRGRFIAHCYRTEVFEDLRPKVQRLHEEFNRAREVLRGSSLFKHLTPQARTKRESELSKQFDNVAFEGKRDAELLPPGNLANNVSHLADAGFVYSLGRYLYDWTGQAPWDKEAAAVAERALGALVWENDLVGDLLGKEFLQYASATTPAPIFRIFSKGRPMGQGANIFLNHFAKLGKNAHQAQAKALLQKIEFTRQDLEDYWECPVGGP